MTKETLVSRTKRMAALLLQMMEQTPIVKMATEESVGKTIKLNMVFTGTVKSGTETTTVPASGEWFYYELKGQDVTIEV